MSVSETSCTSNNGGEDDVAFSCVLEPSRTWVLSHIVAWLSVAEHCIAMIISGNYVDKLVSYILVF